MTDKPIYCVVHRKGTRESFQWFRTGPLTREQAVFSMREYELAGEEAHIEKHALSVSLGLPETFASGDPLPGSQPRHA